MKKLLLLLALVSSLSSHANSSSMNYESDNTTTFEQSLEYIQRNLSFNCGMNIKSKRKMYFNCTSDNAMTFVEVRLKPGDDRLSKRVQKVKINFLNSEDGDYTIANAVMELKRKYPSKCFIKRGRYTHKGKLKGKWSCHVENLGNVIIEDTINLRATGDKIWEEFSVTISK